MQKKNGLMHFLAYNNAVPLALGVLFLSTTATFAASPEARQAVYRQEIQVQSIDNSYIVSVDLERYPFSVRVTEVTEDSENYYVAYDFDTVDVIDEVWQDALKQGTFTVAKAQLGNGDLKEYVSVKVGELIWHERHKLAETQEYEKKLGVSSKVVSTTYSGLVGKFIEPSTERLPQYESEIDPDDPLYVEHPVPLLTWDENDQPDAEEPRHGGELASPDDRCPDMQGIQYNPTACGLPPDEEEEDPPTEPVTPPEEPVTPPEGGVEEPPAEDPASPAEEPEAPEPPAEEGGA